jgi:CheY-like chemotaxis protein
MKEDAGAGERGLVLVVDDVEAHRYVVGSWLRRAGYEVVEAGTGTEALERLDPRLDLVVLDIHLPDMTGFDVCAAIRARPDMAAVPVVHLSATAVDADSLARGLDTGADAYLTEPLEPEEFLATVRAVLRAGAARRRNDRLIEQLTRLAAATLPVNAADSLGRLLEASATGAAAMFGQASFAAGAMLDGQAIRCICPAPGEDPVLDPTGPPLVPNWKPGVNYLGPDSPKAWTPLLERADVLDRHWVALPVYDGRRVAGGIAVTLPAGVDRLTASEESLLARLTEAMKVALDNLRAYTEEHRIALTLQRALLPRELPLVAGAALEGRYFAADADVSVGGDFYDAFELPDGCLAAVIGDVQGHSLHAGTIMAELRFSLRAWLGQPHGVTATLALLDNLMLRNHEEDTASVALLVLDQARTGLVVANAGHLPPLLVTADGRATFLEGGGMLLGVGGGSHESFAVALDPPCALVLVTDGLIERRTGSISEALADLRAAAAELGSLDPADLADALLERFATGDADDDIAVLVVRVDG